MPYRPITANFKKFYNELAYADAVINIRLKNNGFTATEGFPKLKEAEDDAEGKDFVLNSIGHLPSNTKLWANEDSLDVCVYIVTEPDKKEWEFVLPKGDLSPILIHTLRVGGEPAPEKPDTILEVVEAVVKSPSGIEIGQETWSLHISGDVGKACIKCGQMWSANESLGTTQFIEFFMRFAADSDGQYFGDDNDGGDHAGCLVGVGSDGKVTGNTWVDSGSGSMAYSYGSGIPITFDDLGVLARHHTANSITVYWKGVPIGKKTFPTGVRKFLANTAAGHFHIGAYDHQTGKFNIVFCRLAEGSSPISNNVAYHPAKNVARNFAFQVDVDNTSQFNAAWSFTNPYETSVVPDLSNGKEVHAGQGKMMHPAYLSNGNAVRRFEYKDEEISDIRPVYQKILLGQSPYTKTPAAAPSDAIVFDTHERADATYQWSNTLTPGAGQIGGNWTGATAIGNASIGIISEHLLLTTVYEPIFKEVGVSNFEVSFLRADSVYLRDPDHYETYCAKVIDADNYLVLTFDPYGYCYIIDATSRYGASGTGISSFYQGSLSWSELILTLSGNSMAVKVDGTPKWSGPVPSRFAASTKTGIIENTDVLRKIKRIKVKGV
jgi:hypothetical protein